MEKFTVVDALNYPFSPEGVKIRLEVEEVQQMIRTFFKTIPYDVRGMSPPEFVAEMDKAGYDKMIICALKMWSYRRKKLAWDYTIDEVYELIKDFPDRLIGAVSYNPLNIEESLRDIDRAIKQYGFKYVYFHPPCFGLLPNDRRFYPCYAKCLDLGVPVGFQVGQSAELFPSEPGRPIYAEDVALDFPTLTIILSHAGFPWIGEFIHMVWKFPNVYGDIAAWPPRSLPSELVTFMDRAGRDKMLFASNTGPFKFLIDQMMELPIREEAKRKILGENAIKVFKL